MKQLVAVLALCLFTATPLLAGPTPTIAWMTSYADARAIARREGRMLLVDVGAAWCPPCREMLARTYKHPSVVEAARRYIPVLVDFDTQGKVADGLGVDSLPTVLLVDPGGKVVARRSGFQDARAMAAFLSPATARRKPTSGPSPSRG